MAAVTVWQKWEYKDGSPSLVLVVETDLALSPDDPKFNSGNLDDLVDYVMKEFRNPHTPFDRIDIVPRLGKATTSA